MFPTVIEDREEELGYKECDIDNPEKYGIFPDPTIRAIVYNLGVSDRIVKLTNLAVFQAALPRLQQIRPVNCNHLIK